MFAICIAGFKTTTIWRCFLLQIGVLATRWSCSKALKWLTVFSQKQINCLRKSRRLLASIIKSKAPHHSHYYNFAPQTLARPFYTIRSQQPEHRHFGRRGSSGGGPHWNRNRAVVVTVAIVAGAVVVSIYFGNLETVPYMKRTHFVIVSTAVERLLGEAAFRLLKAQHRSKTLPSTHPDSIRVHLIFKDIIEGLQRGLSHGDRRWTDLEYSDSSPAARSADVGPGSSEGILATKGEVEGRGWGREDEAKHLEGLNWEVVVVRDNMVNAFCLPGGKIVVFTGLLDNFRSDAEIATVLGHEIGHAIARHAAERITKHFWFALLQLIILQFFYMPDDVDEMLDLLLKLPFSRRMEIEADYIGILLMASAGYDPRVAPMVYEKLGEITGESDLHDYRSTHPSSKKRAHLLSQTHVMEEALSLYRETVAGRGV